jgi:16S rRNA processing protein RimM
MAQDLLEAGKVVNTHGVRGAVKIQPWANSPDFLLSFEQFYIDGEPYKTLSVRVHRDCVIAELEGVDGIDAAIALKDKVVCIDRASAQLPEGEHFIADLIGLDAIDDDTGEKIGTVTDVFSLPSNNVYVVKGEREMLIPAVPEFVVKTDIQGGAIRFHVIDGM